MCDHTVKVEEEYSKDGLVEDVVEEILIRVGEDDDNDTSEVELDPEDDDVHYHSTGSASPAQTHV
jgi:GTP cyclohydrolase FolE2